MASSHSASTWNPRIAAVVVLTLSLMPDTAHAYLDPGTGSLIIQLVVAGALGALFTIKNFFRSGKELTLRAFRGLSGRAKNNS